MNDLYVRMTVKKHTCEVGVSGCRRYFFVFCFFFFSLHSISPNLFLFSEERILFSDDGRTFFHERYHCGGRISVYIRPPFVVYARGEIGDVFSSSLNTGYLSPLFFLFMKHSGWALMR